MSLVPTDTNTWFTRYFTLPLSVIKALRLSITLQILFPPLARFRIVFFPFPSLSGSSLAMKESPTKRDVGIRVTCGESSLAGSSLFDTITGAELVLLKQILLSYQLKLTAARLKKVLRSNLD